MHKHLLKILFLISLYFLPRNANLANASPTKTQTLTWIGSKYQIQCTMCSACDNPCNTPSSSPPPPPSQTTTTYSPPPPYPPSSSTNYKYPPPFKGGSDGGGGGGGSYYSPPAVPYFSGPTPPNPMVPYFPYYYHSPPYSYSSSNFKKVPCFLIMFILVLCCVF